MKSRASQVLIEFKENSVHVLDGVDGAEFPLERDATGRITAGSRSALANGLRGFLQRNGAVGQRRALCAIPARGVTFRTITLPAVSREDPRRLLAMQLETQLPVAPTELAWGYTKIGNGSGTTVDAAAGPASKAHSEYLVAAVKRDLVDDYFSLLSSCGISPAFTVAALARAVMANGIMHPNGATPFGVLEVGAERSELVTFDEHSVPTLRVLNWGAAQSTKLEPSFLPNGAVPILYVSSTSGSAEEIASALAPSRRAEPLRLPIGQGLTAATHGMRALVEKNQPLLLLSATHETAERRAFPLHWKWAAAVAVLLLCALSFRYFEALLFRAQLTRSLNELRAYRRTLPNLEKEVSFLNFIKTNQPPYLDAIAILSSAAPPGTRFDQVNMARRGDVSIRGSMQDPQGPEKLRSKLIDSGFFSKVVVEEQGPAKQQGGGGQNKIAFRIAAALKPEGQRKLLPPEPPLTNKTSTSTGPVPSGMVPPGMAPPGMPPPEIPPGVLPPHVMPPGALPMAMPSTAVPEISNH